MLKPEDLENFQTIKKQLVNSAILQLMVGLEGAENELDFIIASCLFQKAQDTNPLLVMTQQAMEATIFNPANSLPKNKLNIDKYFDRIQQSDTIHSRIVTTICDEMMDATSISKYASLIHKAIVCTVQKQPSCLTMADVQRIRDLALKQLGNRVDDRAMTCYFEAV